MTRRPLSESSESLASGPLVTHVNKLEQALNGFGHAAVALSEANWIDMVAAWQEVAGTARSFMTQESSRPRPWSDRLKKSDFDALLECTLIGNTRAQGIRAFLRHRAHYDEIEQGLAIQMETIPDRCGFVGYADTIISQVSKEAAYALEDFDKHEVTRSLRTDVRDSVKRPLLAISESFATRAAISTLQILQMRSKLHTPTCCRRFALFITPVVNKTRFIVTDLRKKSSPHSSSTECFPKAQDLKWFRPSQSASICSILASGSC